MGGNAWSRILKNGVELIRVYEQNLLKLEKPTKWFIEMSTDGLIKVYSSYNLWMPLMKVVTSPIDVKYISFASQSRIQFFYEVNEQPTERVLDPIPTTAISTVKYPLFNAVDYPLGLVDICKFVLHFRAIETENSIFVSLTPFSLPKIFQNNRNESRRSIQLHPMDQIGRN